MNRWMAVVAVILVARAAGAQETAQNWPGLATSELSTVYVLDDGGVEASGKLLRVNPDSLVLVVGDVEMRFEAARVRRIQKHGDSLRNGALIGAVVGVALGVIIAGVSDCPGDDPSGSCSGFRAGAFLGSTGFYAAIGAGIDALIAGRTTLYEAQTVPRGSKSVETGRAEINLSLRW